MTWHHVAALLIATLMVISCGLSQTCSAQSFNGVLQLATVIVAGAFGHAGARVATKKPEPHEDKADGR